CIEFLGLDGREVLEAIRSAAPAGLEVRIFMGIHHNGCTPMMEKVLADALSWRDLAGIDLHGTESFPVEPWTAPYWEAARKAGKYTKAHAGEFMGTEFVRKMMVVLQPSRIEHGVGAIVNPAVVKELAR